jgi:hypothetical protein
MQAVQSQLKTNVPATKELSLIALLPKLAGTEKQFPSRNSLIQSRTRHKYAVWRKRTVRIAKLKLTDTAKAFYNASPELHAKDVTSSSFKSTLQKRFKDVRTEQFHHPQVHSTRKLKNEDPLDFADRCPGLAQNLIPQIDDPTAQAQYNDQVQKVLLTCYIAGLTGTAGRHVRFAPPFRHNREPLGWPWQ